MGRNKFRSSVERSRNKQGQGKFRRHKYKSDRQSTGHRRRQRRHYHESSSVSKHHRRSYSSSSSSSASSSSNSSSSSGSFCSSAERRHQTPHYKCRKGEKLNHRYKVKNIMGDGTFGRVVQCEYRGVNYAIKIIKPVQRYIDSARTERTIIKRINQRDPKDEQGIVRYIQSFYHYDHFCMVFKPLGKSLYDFIKMNSFKGFPMKLVQSFFRQILKSIGFLHKIGYTHTDLKPQNILLESQDYYQTKYEDYPYRNKYYLPSRDKVRIIDFGGATRYDQYHSTIINTRQYRSPQVILQCCKWDQISDVWSIGCIICELYTGQLFFPTHDDQEHLAMMQKNSGKFPHWMIQKTQNPPLRKLFLDGYINQDKIDRIQNVIGLKTVQQIFKEQQEIIDLIRRCLEIDPNKRINCRQALKHPFFELSL